MWRQELLFSYHDADTLNNGRRGFLFNTGAVLVVGGSDSIMFVVIRSF